MFTTAPIRCFSCVTGALTADPGPYPSLVISARTDPFSTLWVSPTPLTQREHHPPASQPKSERNPWSAVIGAALWPIAIVYTIHAVFVDALAGDETDDFTTVYLAARRFLAGEPVYNEVYHHVDPHYLYNPGATLLLSPLGMSVHPTAVRLVFVTLSAVAIVATLAWLCRIFSVPRHPGMLPGVIIIAFATETVRNTLIFGNVNGFLFLAFVAFIAAVQTGYHTSAGLALGVCILVKPMFAPIIVLPLCLWRWRTVLTAVAVPVAANLIAWPLMAEPAAYVTEVTPYLAQVRDYANGSIAGLAAYYGWPGWAQLTLRVTVGLAVAVALVLLARWRYTDQLLWLATSSAVLLAGVFCLSSLGQQYYSMMLVPLLFTVVLPRSVAHTWIFWLCAVAIFSPLEFDIPEWGRLGVFITQAGITIGWAGMIVTTAATATVWWRHQKNPSFTLRPHAETRATR